ncbi:UNVERIFIED_CONTAM: hypothetical protein FKN15_040961 [Acipenser sinensis]
MGFVSENWSRKSRVMGSVTEMTKEDIPELSSEGDSVLDRYRSLSSGSERPVVHQVASPPMPADCEFSFFDPNDPKCQEILFSPRTTVSELFAVLRQWVPQVQQNSSVIGNEVRGFYTGRGKGDAETAASFASQLLSMGADPSLRSRWTNMCALHYAAYFDVPELIRVVLKASRPGDERSGVEGEGNGDRGDAETAASFASQLLSMGADPSLRSRWTNMCALHYAAYFDVPELIRVVLKASRPGDERSGVEGEGNGDRDVDATCSDFDFGTALHIAASNLCVRAVKCLLEHGANPAFRNDHGQTPADVVPDPLEMPLEMADAAAVAEEMRQLLLDAMPLACDISCAMLPNYNQVLGKTLLNPLGFRVGDRVIIAGQKLPAFLHTADSPCSHPELQRRRTMQPWAAYREARRRLARPRDAGMQTRTPSRGSVHSEETDIQVGDKVLVVGQRTGVVRFHGKTSFAPGIALDKPNGKNNGSVGGVQYFSCPFKHGVFAPPSRVQRVHGSMDSLTDISSARRNHSFPGIKRSFSTSLTISPQRELSRKSPVNRSRPAFLRRSWSSTSAGSGGLPPAADSAVKLHQGMQVYLTSSNAIATIRYVGPADFAPGMWLGLELQAPKGKNDGSMGNCRYFTCRPNHGVLVRPSRVTYHGINGAKLMDEGR